MALLAGQRIRALDFAGYANGIDGTNYTNLQPAASTWIAPASPTFGVAFMAPTSGAVKCDFGGRLDSGSTATNVSAACELRTGDVINSGVVVDAVSVEYAIEANARLGATSSRIHTGLTPGALYHFLWLCSRSSTTGAITVLARSIAVSPWQA